MRLALLAISAAALSGCSWLGGSSHYGTHPYKSAQSACQTVQGGAHAHQSGYQHMSYGYGGTAGCQTGAYAQAPTSYMSGHVPQPYGSPASGFQTYGAQGQFAQSAGAQGYAAQGYGAQAYGMQGAYGAHGQTAGGFQQSMTTLGTAAPYGSALTTQAGAGYAAGTQGISGGGVQTVVGSPIYVPQPYPAPYGVPQLRGPVCCGVSGGGGGGVSMPFGVEVFAGTEFDVSGNLFTKKSTGAPDGDTSINIRVGEIEPISYADAFGSPTTIGGALAYDVNRNTTVLGAISVSSSEGQTVTNYTTVEPGTWSGTTFTPDPAGTVRGLDGTFSDLDMTTIEAGLRQYVGHDPAFRPYVAATAGVSHNNDVDFVQTYNDDGTLYGQRRFIDAGWSPTASAVFGTEVALSPRAAIGVEAGVRWRDNMNSTAESEDRISIPLTLRGRLAF